jgi:hypothetical protein
MPAPARRSMPSPDRAVILCTFMHDTPGGCCKMEIKINLTTRLISLRAHLQQPPGMSLAYGYKGSCPPR